MPLTAIDYPEGEDDASDAEYNPAGDRRHFGSDTVEEDTSWQGRNLVMSLSILRFPLSAVRTLVVLLATVKSRFSRVSCFLHGAFSSVHRSAYTPESMRMGFRAAKPVRQHLACYPFVEVDEPKIRPAMVKLLAQRVP